MTWVIAGLIAALAWWQIRRERETCRWMAANQQIIMDLVMAARREVASLQTGHERIERTYDTPGRLYDLSDYPDAFSGNWDAVIADRRRWSHKRQEADLEDAEFRKWLNTLLNLRTPYETWLASEEGQRHVAWNDSDRAKRARARRIEQERWWDFTDDGKEPYIHRELNTKMPGFSPTRAARAAINSIHDQGASAVHGEFSTKVQAQAFMHVVQAELDANTETWRDGVPCVHWAFGEREPGPPWVVIIQPSNRLSASGLAEIEERKKQLRPPESD